MNMALKKSFWLLLLSSTTAAAAESAPPTATIEPANAVPSAMPTEPETAAHDQGTVADAGPTELDDLSLERMLSVKVTAASRTPEAA